MTRFSAAERPLRTIWPRPNSYLCGRQGVFGGSSLYTWWCHHGEAQAGNICTLLGVYRRHEYTHSHAYGMGVRRITRECSLQAIYLRRTLHFAIGFLLCASWHVVILAVLCRWLKNELSLHLHTSRSYDAGRTNLLDGRRLFTSSPKKGAPLAEPISASRSHWPRAERRGSQQLFLFCLNVSSPAMGRPCHL